MARWGMPERREAAPLPAAQSAGGAELAPSSPPVPSGGFGAAFKAVVGRKLRELTGRRWEGASERARQAEAARRGAAEMARRIERQTGHRPSEATIRRNARQDRTPRGVDAPSQRRPVSSRSLRPTTARNAAPKPPEGTGGDAAGSPPPTGRAAGGGAASRRSGMPQRAISCPRS